MTHRALRRLLAAAGLAATAHVGATAAAAANPPGDPPTTWPPKTIPTTTLADLTLPAPDSAAPAPTTDTSVEPPATTEAGEPSGIDVPTGAGLSVIVGTVNSMLGDQDDIVAGAAPLIGLPSGIATPIEATVTNLRITFDRDDGSYDAELTLTSPATAADLVVFYQATLAATDLTLDADESEVAEDFNVRRLSYRNDGSDLSGAELTVEVLEPIGSDAGPGGRAIVVLAVVDAAPDTAVNAFTGWTTPDFPTITDGEPVSATVIGTLENGRLELIIQTVFEFPADSADELRDRFLAALPVAGVTLDADADPDADVVTLDDVRRQVPDLTATFSPETDGGTLLIVAGAFR